MSLQAPQTAKEQSHALWVAIGGLRHFLNIAKASELDDYGRAAIDMNVERLTAWADQIDQGLMGDSLGLELEDEEADRA